MDTFNTKFRLKTATLGAVLAFSLTHTAWAAPAKSWNLSRDMMLNSSTSSFGPNNAWTLMYTPLMAIPAHLVISPSIPTTIVTLERFYTHGRMVVVILILLVHFLRLVICLLVEALSLQVFQCYTHHRHKKL